MAGRGTLPPKKILGKNHIGSARWWSLTPLGIVLFLILAAIALVALLGVDLRGALLRWIAAWFGIDAMFAVVAGLIVPHGFEVMWLHHLLEGEWANAWWMAPLGRFSLVTMLLAWIALWVSVRQRRFRNFAIVAALGALVPIASMFTYRLLPIGTFEQRFFANIAALAVITLLALCTFVKPWKVRAAIAGMLAIGVVMHTEAVNIAAVDWWNVGEWAKWISAIAGWLWNPAFFGVMLWWAVKERRSVPRIVGCTACGYDLHGLRAGADGATACPECGLVASV